jgi:hypothetical protein
VFEGVVGVGESVPFLATMITFLLIKNMVLY